MQISHSSGCLCKAQGRTLTAAAAPLVAQAVGAAKCPDLAHLGPHEGIGRDAPMAEAGLTHMNPARLRAGGGRSGDGMALQLRHVRRGVKRQLLLQLLYCRAVFAVLLPAQTQEELCQQTLRSYTANSAM